MAPAWARETVALCVVWKTDADQLLDATLYLNWLH